MQAGDDRETVVAFLPLRTKGDGGLGLLADLRGLVAMARRRHPELSHRNVVDVGIKHEGDRIRATLHFASPL